MTEVITGYLVLTHLNLCIIDIGCKLQNLQIQAVPNFKPATLLKSGCLPFTVLTGNSPDTFKLSIHNTSPVRLLSQESGEVFQEIEADFFPSLSNEFRFAWVKALPHGFLSAGEVTNSALTDRDNPMYIVHHRTGETSLGQECLQNVQGYETISYALSDTTVCGNPSSPFAAWNFVAAENNLMDCDINEAPATLYNGFKLEHVSNPSVDAYQSLLFAETSYGMSMIATTKPFAELTIEGSTMNQGLSTQCAVVIKRICFEARKIKKVFLSFYTPGSTETNSTNVRPRQAERFNRKCVKINNIPTKPVYKVKMRFKPLTGTDLIFIRHIDIRGCFLV